MTAAGAGPVVFAYDGSDLAEAAIAEAGRQLRAGRDALVLTIWEPFNVGFLPVGDVEFNAAQVDQVRKAAEATAAHGAVLAGAAGFQANSMTAEAAPTWRGILDAAGTMRASSCWAPMAAAGWPAQCWAASLARSQRIPGGLC